MDKNTRDQPERLKDLRMQAQKLREKGLSYIEIAKTLGCGRDTASRWCKLDNEELEPKRRGVKEKIALEEKEKLINEFQIAKLSVRRFIKNNHPTLIDRFSQRTIEKYFSEVTKRQTTKKLLVRRIDYTNFCYQSDESFADFCFKVRKNSELSFDQLKELFAFDRKSENWRLWEVGKKPLKSTRLKLAFLSFYNGWSDGEQMPSGLINSMYYKNIFQIRWGLLKKFDLSRDVLISHMVDFIRYLDGEPRKLPKDICMQDEVFYIECNKFIGFFSFLKPLNIKEDGESVDTWMAADYYKIYAYLLDLMMTASYDEYEIKIS